MIFKSVNDDWLFFIFIFLWKRQDIGCEEFEDGSWQAATSISMGGCHPGQ